MTNPSGASTIIEVHLDGQWVPAATIRALGAESCRVDYTVNHLFTAGARPIAHSLPLERDPDQLLPGQENLDRRPPPFIYDLVPQGKGRKYLLGKLGLADSDAMVMPLVMAGAFNPIGNLRLRSALEFYEDQVRLNAVDAAEGGMSMKDIAERSSQFAEHISLHSMLAAGTTGVQGVAPKFLLAKDADGRWFADLALPDDQAHSHWIVKLPRGSSTADLAVLRNEVAYLRLAELCGLRAAKAELIAGNMLFAKRFDRKAELDGSNARVTRIAQESLASVAGLRGFAPAASQNQLVHALRAVATHPTQATVEFIKRDILNLAMRNTDNHARNTAVQTLPDGTAQLTPIYDFAPMFLDPEVVTRSLHWRDTAGARISDWRRIMDSLGLESPERDLVIDELSAFAEVVASLPKFAEEAGVDPDVIDSCRQNIIEQARLLDLLGSTQEQARAVYTMDGHQNG